jgi:hypothetical protein
LNDVIAEKQKINSLMFLLKNQNIPISENQLRELVIDFAILYYNDFSELLKSIKSQRIIDDCLTVKSKTK